MAPEFANMLPEVPQADRTGWVFRPLDAQGAPLPRTRRAIGPRVGKIGLTAGVVVDQREKRDDDGKAVTVNAFAGAHDLRRSFGFRWSRLVMPTILRELMRHESIDATMRYYVGVNAESTADEFWRVAGSIQGSIDVTGDSTPAVEIAASR